MRQAFGPGQLDRRLVSFRMYRRPSNLFSMNPYHFYRLEWLYGNNPMFLVKFAMKNSKSNGDNQG